ncbi:MAG TPA: M56 family metallopeptidase [Candidatus Sulfopaludibacter sp.]|jgi:beta-lactamase regulating signal transducer with metallopeptidase domain|nr:M56 family metallopeptidase [Candidatus Sulfopaludibacter sp.]
MNSLNSASAAVLAGVLNTLWLAIAATALLWLALRYMSPSAAARHRVWWGWLLMVLLLPAAPSMLRSRRVRNVVPLPPVAASLPAAFVPAPVAAAPLSADTSTPIHLRTRRGPLALLALWLSLVLIQAIRLFWSARHLHRLKESGRPPKRALRESFEAWTLACRVQRPVRLLVSDQLASPLAVGFRYPAVMVPASLIDNLSGEEMDHVLLHELAHIARRDDWTNLIVRVATGLLVWHPAAAWVLRRIDREREMACDEWVVEATGQPRPYAASLARLFELCWTRKQETLAMGMAGRRSHLGERIETLVRRTGKAAPRSLLRAALCAAVLVVLLIGGARAPRWVAFAQDVAPRRTAKPLPPANPQSFLAAVVATGYGDLPVDDIIGLKSHGVSADFLRGMSQTGWAKLTAQQLIDLRQRGVSPEYVRDIRVAGIRDLTIQEVIDLRTHGVPSEFPREVHSLGFGPFSSQQVVELFTHGARPPIFQALKEGGFVHLAPNEIIEAQHSGLQAANLREAKQYGSNLSLSQIIRLKRAGVI